jgi:hypothetical protein
MVFRTNSRKVSGNPALRLMRGFDSYKHTDAISSGLSFSGRGKT